jgi:dihydroxyacetone kinase-like protein
MDLTIEWVREWMRQSARAFDENRVELGVLDREIGDGDHGENMQRGFAAVMQMLDRNDEQMTPGQLLRAIATILISSVGGAAGPLYGTAFLKGSDAAADAPTLDSQAIADVLRAARDGIVLRGKAEVGDKTMVDAWTPAVEAATAAAGAGEDPHRVLEAAAVAAAEGAASTEPLIARKGRASYLGERAIGHRDPGAQSSALLLRAAADAAAHV